MDAETSAQEQPTVTYHPIQRENPFFAPGVQVVSPPTAAQLDAQAAAAMRPIRRRRPRNFRDVVLPSPYSPYPMPFAEPLPRQAVKAAFPPDYAISKRGRPSMKSLVELARIQHRTPMGRLVRVPQPVFGDPVTLRNLETQVITFQRVGLAEPGVRVGDLDAVLSPEIVGATDCPFKGATDRQIRMQIVWPKNDTCTPWERRIRTLVSGKDITREKLLGFIHAGVRKFVTGTKLNLKPEYGRWGTRWAIGVKCDGTVGIRPRDIVIMGLVHRGASNWQLELCVPWEEGDDELLSGVQ